MKGVAAVPVRPLGESVPAHGILLPRIGWADVHWLQHISDQTLGTTVAVAPSAELAQLEDRLVDLLAIADLCRANPLCPHAPGGPVTYPRWGDIYYIRGLEPAQTKRYVVVTHDQHNAVPGARPFAVRTTSQPKYNHPDFPPIQDGFHYACCGDVLGASLQSFDLANQPAPHLLPPEDMRLIAYGLVSTLGLEDAAARAGADPGP